MKNGLYYINKDSLINSFIGIELIDEFKDMSVLINYDDKLFYVNKDILTTIEMFDKNTVLCSGIKYCNETDFYEIVKSNNDIIFKDLESIFNNDIKTLNKTDKATNSKIVSGPSTTLINTTINNKIAPKTGMYYAEGTLYDYNPNTSNSKIGAYFADGTLYDSSPNTSKTGAYYAEGTLYDSSPNTKINNSNQK